MNRRQLLRRGLLLGAAGLAGCQNDSDSTPTTPPASETPTGTATDTRTPTATESQTPTETATEEPTETATPEPPAIPPTLERTYEPAANVGDFRDVVVLSSGDYVFAGATGSAGESSSGWLVRVGPDGTQRWARTYGSGATTFSAVTQADDGTLVAAGQTQPSDGTGAGFVQAVATDGTAQWSNTLTRDTENVLSGAVGTASGAVVTGATDFGNRGSASGWVLELDGSGSVVAERTISGGFIRAFNGALDVGDGRYGLVGVSSPTRGRANGLLVVVDDQLETTLTQEYNVQTWEGFRSGAVLSDGGFLLVGDSTDRRTLDNSNEDAWFLRADSDGIQQWSTTHDMTDGDRVTGAIEPDDGSYFCVGRTGMNSNGTDEAFVARVSSDGSVSETSTYGNDDEQGAASNTDYLSCLARASDGTLVAGGLKNLGQTDGTVTGLGWLLTF